MALSGDRFRESMKKNPARNYSAKTILRDPLEKHWKKKMFVINFDIDHQHRHLRNVGLALHIFE